MESFELQQYIDSFIMAVRERQKQYGEIALTNVRLGERKYTRLEGRYSENGRLTTLGYIDLDNGKIHDYEDPVNSIGNVLSFNHLSDDGTFDPIKFVVTLMSMDHQRVKLPVKGFETNTDAEIVIKALKSIECFEPFAYMLIPVDRMLMQSKKGDERGEVYIALRYTNSLEIIQEWLVDLKESNPSEKQEIIINRLIRATDALLMLSLYEDSIDSSVLEDIALVKEFMSGKLG
jgi:hypothetical protein